MADNTNPTSFSPEKGANNLGQFVRPFVSDMVARIRNPYKAAAFKQANTGDAGGFHKVPFLAVDE